MKRSFVCLMYLLFSCVAISIVSHQAISDDYLDTVTVYIDRVTHYGGVIYHFLTETDEKFTIHFLADGEDEEHDHRPPIVKAVFNDITCPLSPSQCDHCL